AVAVKAQPIGNPCAHDGGLEPGCLRNSPSSHKTAITPTGDAQSFRISNAQLNAMVDPGQDVLKVFSTKIAHIRFCKLQSPPHRTSKIGKKNCHSSRRQQLNVPVRRITESAG